MDCLVYKTISDADAGDVYRPSKYLGQLILHQTVIGIMEPLEYTFITWVIQPTLKI